MNELTTIQDNSLTTFSTKYIIVFHSGSIMEITGEQHETVLEQSTQPNARLINIDNQSINFASISQILSLHEYYKQYPDKIPEQRDIFKPETLEELSEEASKESEIEKCKGLIKGLKRYISENPETKAHKDLSILEKKLSTLI